ncbi:MAG: alpha-N-acetylglucosaminidase [Candidatus Hydrogenedentes bacterium]|nr:alpha-N-acetylglucosaminidase [Candidatus Hydrogenedentota bacterium]
MKRIPVLLTLMLFAPMALADTVSAARGLIGRVLPDNADLFSVEVIPQENSLDVFEVESVGGKIVLRGSSGVAAASALNWYLRQYCLVQISWRGGPVTLPDPPPRVAQKVRKTTPFDWRYCFNYCCFSYSMAWWDWPEWERAIDWMAMNGINMPLAVTGQESVWREVGRSLGLGKDDMDRFFVGAAYLPFGWMGCMDGWGGPLTESWIDRHAALGKRILDRERELGMKPVLQGFTGHVPAALKEKFPDAKFQQLPSWCGFPGTTFVDPHDPLFEEIGRTFITEQTRQFGTDHLYASDTFIEMSPPSNDPAFLDAMGKAVHGAMRAGDPDAVWVMQGWLFVNNPDFWQPPQAKALLDSVADDRMLVLDLYCESRPAWKLTESFHGKPWLWCIIQDFGDVVSMHGGLPQISHGLSAALADPSRGKLRGAGLIMEGMGYNPVVHDLATEMFWSPEKKGLEAWVSDYARQRYGRHNRAAESAWRGFLETAYGCSGRNNSVICMRPALNARDVWGGGKPPYKPERLAGALDELLSCADEFQGVDNYQYDVAHVTRQVLSEIAGQHHARIMQAHADGNRDVFGRETAAFLELLDNMDRLLATRPEFLLGKWLEDAKRWGNNEEEKRLLEWNARNQITLWGPADGVLHDYAQKQWSGLVRGFYKPRWEQFFDALRVGMDSGATFEAEAFTRTLQEWEAAWTHQTENHPATPSGEPVTIARELLEKYRQSAN